jgi:hypothetical protein
MKIIIPFLILLITIWSELKAQEPSDSLLFQSFLNNSEVRHIIHLYEDSCANYHWQSYPRDSGLVLLFESDTLIKISNVDADTNCSIIWIYSSEYKYFGLIKVRKVKMSFIIKHNVQAKAYTKVYIEARYKFKKGVLEFKGFRSKYSNVHYSPMYF